MGELSRVKKRRERVNLLVIDDLETEGRGEQEREEKGMVSERRDQLLQELV